MFGEGAGDSRGEQLDDAAYGPIKFDIPIIFFEAPQYTVYVCIHVHSAYHVANFRGGKFFTDRSKFTS